MKEFNAAKMEIILFEDDMIVASSEYCCMGQQCMCDGQQWCSESK